jgi:hypothetical protein
MMTADEYIRWALSRYEVPRGPFSQTELVAAQLKPALTLWAGNALSQIAFSGSYAKGTGVKGTTDIDLFISLKADTPGTLKDIYESLFSFASAKGWGPRRQNVSIGVTYGGVATDLVPGRIQNGYQNYHSLWRHKKGSWTQTNVALQTSTVQASGRIEEIRALKVWRQNHGLDFPSFYLELTVLDALYRKPQGQLASNVLSVLSYLGESFATARVVDPSNTNNVVSDDLTAVEKKTIVDQAKKSRQQESWTTILW